MPIIPDAATGLLVLRDLLRAKMLAPAVQTALEGYGAVQVVRAEDPENLDGLSRIVLSIENDVYVSEWLARGLTIGVQINVSEFGGSLIGAENPVSLDTYLGRFLQNAVLDYDFFNDAGLWGIALEGLKEGAAARDTVPGASNTCRLICYYDPTT